MTQDPTEPSAAALLEANEHLVLAVVKAHADADAANRLLVEATRSFHLDALTGLPDRILFLDRLEQALTHARRHGTRLALLFLDVDHFKAINDSFGHATGDEVLRVIALALVSRVRKGDTVSRHGGDEFVVLLTEVASPQDAVSIAGKLSEGIEASRDIFGDLVDLKVSIGVSVFPDDGQDATSLIARADAAMYRVKSARRGGASLPTDSASRLEEVVQAAAEPARRWSTTRTASDDGDIRNALLREANERLIVAVLDAQSAQIAAQRGQPYRTLIDRMGEGAVTLDEYGTVLFSSETFARMVGLRTVDIVGVDFSRLLPIEAEAEAFLEVLSDGPGAGLSKDVELQGPGGMSIPVRIGLIEFSQHGGGSARVICGIVADRRIESRTIEVESLDRRLSRAIAERSKSEERLELALEAAGMGSWELDLDSGVLWCARRADRIFGRVPLLPDARLADMLEQVLPEDRRMVERAFDEAVKSGLLDVEFRIERPDSASIRWLHFKAKAFHEFGRPVRISGVVSDVSDRRSVEDQLRQAQKMEAVGQLTGGIAHDFNNLLLVIGGSIDLLSRRLPPEDERTVRLINAARKGVDRGAKLNQQLLAFSRRQELRPEVLCMDDLVPAFGDLAAQAVGPLVLLQVVQPVGCWFCEADRNQLETAILNLVINARDAMPDGGTLTIAAENRTLSATEAAIRGAKAGDYCVVSVEDTGFGMTREVISRVFEPFFTTKAAGLGTGLGLSQTYGFAKQSDGFVEIESEPGTGTRIAIFLPRSRAAVAAPPTARASQMPIGQDGGTVLVVDDEAEVRATTSAMLRDLGYVVYEADSASVALDLFDAGLRVDVVFSDVIMPGGMNGKRLAAELVSRNPSQAILLTSGFTGALADNEPPSGRPFPTLKKPYSLSELASTVKASVEASAKASGGSFGH